MSEIKNLSRFQKVNEENPFEDDKVAKEWINSVENEIGMGRDKAIYPRLETWMDQFDSGRVVEIGSGQGVCSSHLGNFAGQYIGIEPSPLLTRRAQDLYESERRQFVVGNAYDLPIESESADAAFSVMVWFHLGDLDVASSEFARVLKPRGKFLIITANPRAEKIWEAFYFDYNKEGKKIVGAVNVPINPMSKNIHYQHSIEEISDALNINGLKIAAMEEFGAEDGGEKLFLSIRGQKSSK